MVWSAARQDELEGLGFAPGRRQHGGAPGQQLAGFVHQLGLIGEVARELFEFPFRGSAVAPLEHAQNELALRLSRNALVRGTGDWRKIRMAESRSPVVSCYRPNVTRLLPADPA